ncbi:MAG: class I SAM-dependent methyltransferase [Nitrospiraceae bacterium]|nr:MAG: class I SAM-dependent methyltransferase [Nitrospiraceae bacterium]
MRGDGNRAQNVTEAWQKALKDSGYEHQKSRKTKYAVLKTPRLWKKIFKHMSFAEKSNLSAFEVGCGGGKHIASLSLNGWNCVGIDCSREVLERARQYIDHIASIIGKALHVDLLYGDISHYTAPHKFDLVFQVGVLEHFLEDAERANVLLKMLNLTKPGGHIVSVVPNGKHPFRKKMKELHLGGYNIPEIDYNSRLMFDEMHQCGFKEITVLPHNLFSYLLMESHSLPRKFWYYMWQTIPTSILPQKFAFRHAGTLICIAQKPSSNRYAIK